ncbi:hypothetical protein V8E54_013770 [Elaphomyces granulatus]
MELWTRFQRDLCADYLLRHNGPQTDNDRSRSPYEVATLEISAVFGIEKSFSIFSVHIELHCWRSRKDPLYYKHCPGEAPPSLTFQGAVVRSGGAMNRGATLLHYDFKICTYNSATKTQAQFTIRAYLKNDGFTFLGSNDGPAQHSSPQTPLSSNKRTLRDLWDRTDVDGIGGPSTPTKRCLPFDEDAPSSSQVEVPETPLPSSTPGTAVNLDHSDSETDAGEEMSSIARGKQPQRGRKGRKKNY